MQLFIQFPDFSNTTSINKSIEKRLRSIYRRLEGRYENPIITVRGSVLNRKTDGSPKMFEAELIVKLPKSKAPFIVKKKNKEFRVALNNAADAMEKIIRRDSSITYNNRHKLGKTNIPVRRIDRAAELTV